MANRQLLLPQDIYCKHLQTIDGANFTSREMEVIACLLNGKTEKTTASVLSIDERAVNSHTSNIRRKLGVAAREGILNFIERSDKADLIKNSYYETIKIRASFETELKKLHQSRDNPKPICYIVDWKEQGEQEAYIHSFKSLMKKQLLKHLESIHLNVSTIEKAYSSLDQLRHDPNLQNDGHIILLIDSDNLNQLLVEERANQSSNTSRSKTPKPLNISFIVLEQETVANEGQALGSEQQINIFGRDEYYLAILKALEILLPDSNIDKIEEGFRGKWEKPSLHFEFSLPRKDRGKNETPAKDDMPANVMVSFFIKRWKEMFGAVLIGMCLLSGIFLFFRGANESISNSSATQFNDQAKQIDSSIRSDLIIPAKYLLLDRADLVTQIEEKFKGQEDIQTVALVGLGGAGKTTLARKYARQQKANVIWEVNAETPESLKAAFEKLACSLATTERDRQKSKEFREIKDATEREERVLKFVREHLKTQSDWFLIYDNVERFADIQKHFPQDSNTWGRGRIILTTRDNNIQNNKNIDHVLQIGELSSAQKLRLFGQIMSHGKMQDFTAYQTVEVRKFLEEIPPFPLDVSIAAYYLKATNVPYKKYLERLQEHDKGFSNIQESIIKGADEYTKTRYSIINLSLKRIIDANKNFAGLLLFISLLDSQNIPRDLLDAYKDELVVDGFIYNLNKYSLIIKKPLIDPETVSTFSFHRSTQESILAFFKEALNLKINHPDINKISQALEKYSAAILDKEDLSKIKMLKIHFEKLLSHKDLLSLPVRAIIDGNLGCLYLVTGDFLQSRAAIERSLKVLNENYNENKERIAYLLIYLSNAYKGMEDNGKAKELLEKSLHIYKKMYPQDHAKIAEILTHLGYAYAYSGNHAKAELSLRESLEIYKKNNINNPIKVARALAYLGYILRWEGNYMEAKNLLLQSLSIYKNSYPANQINLAQVLGYLGVVYENLGFYKEARDCFAQTLSINKRNYPQDHTDVAWAVAHLGNIYMYLGKYEKAKSLVEQSLRIYKMNCSKRGRLALNLRYLGNIHKELGNYAEAKRLFKDSLAIYEHKDKFDYYIDVAYVLKDLGETYLMEGDLNSAEKLINQSYREFDSKRHPERYLALETLAELYLKKSKLKATKQDISQAQSFKQHAIDYLRQANEVATKHFPPDSPHLTRIQSKLDQINKS